MRVRAARGGGVQAGSQSGTDSGRGAVVGTVSLSRLSQIADGRAAR